MTDDVRVRLSADGVQEVVSALKRIRDEAKKTGEEGGKSMESLKEGFHELGKELLGFAAIGAVIEGVVDLFKEVTKNALEIGKLHQSTGMAVESLQALNQIAEDSSVSQESLNKSLNMFSRNLGLVGEGSKKAAAGFNALGISVKELKQQTPDQQFLAVAKRLMEITDAGQRAAIGSQIFGKQFAELQPVLEEVAKEGLDPVIAQMRRMGTLLDEDTIRQFQEAKKAAHDMKDELAGLATQFLVGLMPAARKAMDELVQDTTGAGVNGFKVLGEWVGKVTNGIVTGLRLAGATIGYLAAQIENMITSGKDGLKDFAATAYNIAKLGMFGGAGALLPKIKPSTSGSYNDRSKTIQEAYQQQLAKIMEDFDKDPKLEAPAEHHGESHGFTSAPNVALAKAQLELLIAQLQAELKVYQAQSKLKLDTEKQEYEEGRIALEKYFADRAEVLNKQYDKELEILKKRRAAVKAQPIELNDDGTGAAKRAAELAAVQGDIDAKEYERQSAMRGLDLERFQAQKKNAQDMLKAEAQLLTLQGQRTEAARKQLEIEIESLRTELRKTGRSPDDIDATLAKYKAAGTAKIDYDKTKQDAEATLSQLNSDIRGIQDQVASGTLFPVQGEQQIIDLEKQRLPVLQEMATRMTELAKATNDPAMIAQAAAFTEQIKGLSIAVDEAGQQMAVLKSTAQQALQGGVAQFLYDVGTGTKNLGQAFRGLALSFAESLAKMESEYLSKEFIKWLMGDGKGSGPLAGLGSMLGSGAGAAQGAESMTATLTNTTAVTANTAAVTALTAALAANTGSNAAGSAGGLGGLLSLFGSGEGAGAGAAAGSEGGGEMFAMFADMFAMAAGGGEIRGPGTSTSDSIPAMLSDKEFVVNAQATSRPGVLALLHAINGTPGMAGRGSAGAQRYAQGGAVSGGGPGMSIKVVNVPDASLLGQHLDSAVGEQQVLNIISRNPQRVRQTLGGS